MELVDPFGWHKIESTKIHWVRQKLGEFESMTWNQILVEAKKHHHTISVSSICSEAKKRLKAIGQSDLEEIVSLRLTGTERVWGIRSQGVFTVLWWDPNHLVYPYVKKNT